VGVLGNKLRADQIWRVPLVAASVSLDLSPQARPGQTHVVVEFVGARDGNELKSRGYKVVHVVPAAADRPKTATSAEQWVARPTPEHHTSPPQMRPLRQGISRRHGETEAK